jgi:RHS repeat-associated protein
MIQLGPSSGPSDVLELTYGDGDASGTDNGNVVSQVIKAGTQEVGTQSYTYDGVNRIESATEALGSVAVWAQNFDYDQFGNMAITHSDITLSSLTPTVVNGPGSAFNPSTNRLLASLYDSNGNQKKDGQGSQFSYDAENRMTSSANSATGVTTNYSYDGDGHRVTKSSGGTPTVFVYNAREELVAEYNGISTNGGISYLTTDHLGSTRAVTGGSGSNPGKALARYDYQPFGAYVPPTLGGGRKGFPEYGGMDDTSHKFTSKERDIESGLDYLLARCYSSSQGRFLSADTSDSNPATLYQSFDASPGLPNSSLLNPQTLNAYTYAYNNPMTLADPTGHAGKVQDLPGNSRYKIRVDRSNTNDAPNIHVFDKGGKRELGRVALKPSGPEWTGNVPQSVRSDVEAFAKLKGIEPRLPTGSAERGARGSGFKGGKGGAKGLLTLALLDFIADVVDSFVEAERRKNQGYHVESGPIFGLGTFLVIDDPKKAAQSLGEGYRVNIYFNVGESPYLFQVEDGQFVSHDPRCGGACLLLGRRSSGAGRSNQAAGHGAHPTHSSSQG